MSEVEDSNESDLIEPPQESLFSLNSNFNSLEINKMMKSSTNLFSHLSPLFTKTMTSFHKEKNQLHLENRNSKSKKHLILNHYLPSFENCISKQKQNNFFFGNNNLRTQKNLKKSISIKQFLLGPKNPPSINDKIGLTSYYKSGYNKMSNKSPQEKEYKKRKIASSEKTICEFRIKLHSDTWRITQRR